MALKRRGGAGRLRTGSSDGGHVGASSLQANLCKRVRLRNSGNPKLANSRFVSFIDKVSKGDLQFKENTVIDREGRQVDWESLYDTDVATASASERSQLVPWATLEDKAYKPTWKIYLGITFALV